MSEAFILGIGPRPIRHIAHAQAGPGFVLTVEWAGGGGVTVDLAGWIGMHGIEALRSPAVFSRPEIGEDGDTVQWAGDEDLCIDSVHLELLAEQQRAFDAAELAARQERRGLTNQEAADLMGVPVNTWVNYRSAVTPVPRGVAIACRALERDPLLFAANYRPRRGGHLPSAPA